MKGRWQRRQRHMAATMTTASGEVEAAMTAAAAARATTRVRVREEQRRVDNAGTAGEILA